MTREERLKQIRDAACAYRDNEGEGVRGWEEIAFERGALWADQHPAGPWVNAFDRNPRHDTECIVTFDGSYYEKCRWNDTDTFRGWLPHPACPVHWWMPIAPLPKNEK